MLDRAFNVLIVDDERGMREGCRRILARYAKLVETAGSGEEALEKFESGLYDLALVDIKMPGMNGLELLDRLRAQDPDLVSLVITGYATLETAIEATKRGAFDMLPKPFTPDELLSKVWNALERRHLSLEAKRLREERERRLLEIAAEKSRLRTVINCIQDGVLVTNRDGELVLYNPAAMHFLNCDNEALLRRRVDQCLAQPALVELFREVLHDDFPYAMLAREFVSTGDDQVTCMANVAPVLDEEGDKLGAVAVLRDISQLKEADRAKSQFISLVSHELRAPLAAIEGYLGLVVSDLIKDDPEEQRSMLMRSRARAQALLNLIDDLLDISRIEAGQLAKQVESLNLADVAREIVVLLRPQATAKGVVLYDEMPTRLPPVAADHEDMVHVFTNLIGNAVKYNRPGGSVWLRAQVEGAYARIDVVDSGIGIPAEALGKIFDEFHRVKRRETLDIPGTGLGLTIAKRTVESYHGRIKVSSELGAGSTFTVLLPLSNGA